MKVLIPLLLCVSTTICFSQDYNVKTNDSIVYWCEGRALSWSDFKGVPAPSESLKAMTFSSVPVELEMSSSRGIIGYKVFAVFKKESWTSTRDYVCLKHEQLHFDISELYARQIRKVISSNKGLKEAQIMRLINSRIKALYNTQSNYDQDTDHGTNMERQQFWADLIHQELDSLKAFKMDNGCP